MSLADRLLIAATLEQRRYEAECLCRRYKQAQKDNRPDEPPLELEEGETVFLRAPDVTVPKELIRSFFLLAFVFFVGAVVLFLLGELWGTIGGALMLIAGIWTPYRVLSPSWRQHRRNQKAYDDAHAMARKIKARNDRHCAEYRREKNEYAIVLQNYNRAHEQVLSRLYALLRSAEQRRDLVCDALDLPYKFRTLPAMCTLCDLLEEAPTDRMKEALARYQAAVKSGRVCGYLAQAESDPDRVREAQPRLYAALRRAGERAETLFSRFGSPEPFLAYCDEVADELNTLHL